MTPAELIAALREGVRPIPGWPSYYAASCGRVLSTRRGARFLAPRAHHRTGHLRVRLYDGRGGFADAYVHRLIALAWHGPPSGDDDRVLHADDDPANNRPDNLSWGTYDDNQADRMRNRRAGGQLDPWRDHEAVQAFAGRGIYVPDPRWGF